MNILHWMMRLRKIFSNMLKCNRYLTNLGFSWSSEYRVYPHLFCMRNSSLIFHATYLVRVIRRFTFVWVNSELLYSERNRCWTILVRMYRFVLFERKIGKGPLLCNTFFPLLCKLCPSSIETGYVDTCLQLELRHKDFDF